MPAVGMPEWMENAAPSEMGAVLGRTASPRKAGLFIRHLCRCFAGAFCDPRSLAAIDAADRHEGGEVSEYDLQAAIRTAEEAAARLQDEWDAEWQAASQAAADAGSSHATPRFEVQHRATAARVAREVAARGHYPQVLVDLRGVCHHHAGVSNNPRQKLFSRVVRPAFFEHFGDVRRPVTLDPAWLTSTVLALARGIYEERGFDRMPILADALQDAGCDNPDVLDHCRGDGPHVRGCWVVDLVLGKG